MPDRDRAISRLQVIRTWAEVGKTSDGIQGAGCLQDVVNWIDDALELLKEQEPRVLMALEVKPCLPYWLEFPEGELRPVICYDAEWDAKEPYITLVWQYGTSSYETELYGLGWRCWSSRPTDEQREETPWRK